MFSGTFLVGLITQTESAAETWRELGDEVERTTGIFDRAVESGNRAAAASVIPQQIVALQNLRAEVGRNFNMPLSALPGGLQDPNLLIMAAERNARRGPVDLRRMTEPAMQARARSQELLRGDVDPFRIANEIPPEFLTLSQAQAFAAIDDRIRMLQLEAQGLAPGAPGRLVEAQAGATQAVDTAAQDRIRTNIARAILDPLRQALVDEDWDDVGRQIVLNLQQAILEAFVFQPAQEGIVSLLQSFGQGFNQLQRQQDPISGAAGFNPSAP